MSCDETQAEAVYALLTAIREAADPGNQAFDTIERLAKAAQDILANLPVEE